MRILKNTHELIRQNEQIVKKSQKQDVNLQKNSTLYFQIGLIVCLIATYGLLEMRFETALSTNNNVLVDLVNNNEPYVTDFKIYKAPLIEVKPEAVKKVVLTIDPKIVDNHTPDLTQLDVITPDQKQSSSKIVDTNTLNVEPEPVDEPLVDFISIESVPIFPGCENKKTNPERRQCMSDKLSKFIQNKFDANLASDLGLTGIQKIQTQFTIDKTGHIIDIKTRAIHPKLAHEAKRVITSIPKMKPGKQRDKPVGVRYTLPIKFQAGL